MKVNFDNPKKPGFHSAVRDNVNNYFKENNISKNGNAAMYLKSFFFVSLLFLLYGLIISNKFSGYPLFSLAIALGMAQSFIGFNVCHDAIHESFSSSKKVNKIFSTLFNVIGANAYMWKITHNIVHHTFTNIQGHDEDLDVAPNLVRLSPIGEAKPIMKFQHIYAFLLYGLTSLSWVFIKDFVKFFQKKIGETDNTNHPKIEYFNLFFYKIVYYILFIAVPLYVMDITWWQFAIGFFAMHFAEGVVLGTVFQLAHVVEQTDFPEVASTEGTIEDSWAVHQMKTTADFARDSFIATFFCGGLNFQIEHHLFPYICHTHYPSISKIVKATAEKYDVPYYESKTFIQALGSHYRTLKRFGRNSDREILA